VLSIQVGSKRTNFLRGPQCGAWLLLAAFLLGACSPGPDPVQESPAVDIVAAQESLLRQDLRFAEVAYEEGIAEAYRRFMAEDAVQLPDGGLAIAGRDVIYEELLALSEGVDFVISWEPVEVDVAASGELGYTWGIYYYEALDELGAPFIAEGKYVYLWRNNNGRWELILDITNQTEPAYEEELSEEVWIEEDVAEGQAVPEELPD
jgi:ketosteroid isomerase-like protein